MSKPYLKEYSRTKNSIINITTGFGGQLLTILLKFVGRTIFIKTLGVEYLGISGLFSDILSMLSLAELGFDTAISFRLYKPVSEKDSQKVSEYLRFFRNVYRIIGLIIFVVGLSFIPFLKYFIKDFDSLSYKGINAGFIFVLLLVQNVSTYLFFAYRVIALRVNQKQYVLDITGYFFTIFTYAVQILVLVIFKDYNILILTLTILGILQNLVYARIATKAYPEYFNGSKGMLSKSERADLFKDCGALFVYKINNVVVKATDNIVLSAFIGLTIVGLYSNYLLIFATISAFLKTMFRSVKDSMGNLFVTDDVEKKYFFFEVMNMVAVLFYGTAAIGVALVSNELIECWIGSDFVLPQPLPILIGIELLFTGLKLNLAQIRHVSGVFRQMWFRPVIGSIINVVASLVLVRYWGISGVICGTLMAALFANLLIDPVVIHKHGFNNIKPVSYYYKKNIGFLVLLVLIGVMDYFLCLWVLPNHGVLSLIVHSVICLASVIPIFSIIYHKSGEYKYLRSKTVQLVDSLIKKHSHK